MIPLLNTLGCWFQQDNKSGWESYSCHFIFLHWQSQWYLWKKDFHSCQYDWKGILSDFKRSNSIFLLFISAYLICLSLLASIATSQLSISIHTNHYYAFFKKATRKKIMVVLLWPKHNTMQKWITIITQQTESENEVLLKNVFFRLWLICSLYWMQCISLNGIGIIHLKFKTFILFYTTIAYFSNLSTLTYSF